MQTDRSVYAARVSDRDDGEGREGAAGDASTRGARLRAGRVSARVFGDINGANSSFMSARRGVCGAR